MVYEVLRNESEAKAHYIAGLNEELNEFEQREDKEVHQVRVVKSKKPFSDYVDVQWIPVEFGDEPV